MADDKQLSFILSDPSRLNSKGFRLDLQGGRYDRFDSNPVMLYDHNPELVIGRWSDRAIRNGCLVANAVFDDEDPVAAEKARKVRQGFLKGSSIGLIVFDMQQIDNEWVATDWEMLEASVTPIPSDAGAVKLYNEKMETISFEDLKLNFSNNQQIKMADNFLKLTDKTRQWLGLSQDATAPQIEGAVEKLQAKLTELETSVKKMHETEIDTFLQLAVADGKITSAEVPQFKELSVLDFSKVKTLIDKKKSQPSTRLSQMAVPKGNSATANPSNWDYLTYSQKDPRGLQRLKLEQPEEFNRLKNEYINNQIH